MDWLSVVTAPAEAAETQMSQAEMIAWTAGIATALATSLTALFTVWFRRIDRPSCEWHLVLVEQGWAWDDIGGMTDCSYSFRLSNAGNGTAQSVSLYGVHCSLQMRNQHNETRDLDIPLVDPGYSALIRAAVIPTKWDQTQLLITWTEQSLWRRKKKKRKTALSLSKFFPEPVIQMSYRHPVRKIGSLKVAELPSDHDHELADIANNISQQKRVVLAHNNRRIRRKQFRMLKDADEAWQRIMPRVNNLNK